MTEHIELHEVDISCLLVDEKYHSRKGYVEHMVSRYESVYKADYGDEVECRMPPLEVAEINGIYVLFDGFHRHKALVKAGIQKVMVNVYEGHSYTELPYLASKYNLSHGVPMSTKDVRKIVFAAYIKSRSNMDGCRYKSYREIAGDFNDAYSYNTFRNWLKSDFPAVFEAMGKDDEGEIEFEPLDPDWENYEGAISSLGNFILRFEAIKSEDFKVMAHHKLETFLSDIRKVINNEEAITEYYKKVQEEMKEVSDF